MVSSLTAVLVFSPLLATSAGPFLPITETARWGFARGIQVAVYPNGIGAGGAVGGPRGLLRIGYPILPDGGISLINFIAIEPLVSGQKGYSELERGADGRQGKVITPSTHTLSRRNGHDRLCVSLAVERFANGAHVRLEVCFDSALPDEVELRAHSEPDSAEIQECVLSATMGNYGRLRRAHLADRIVDSGIAYSTFFESSFAPDIFLPEAVLARTPSGDILIPVCPDESDLQSLQETLPPGTFWRYPGAPVTQYWRAPRGTYGPALRLRLNGRATYWMTEVTIPGGVAFENFELRDAFHSGQPFIFGVTSNAPDVLLNPPPAVEEQTRAWLAGWN